MAMQLKKIWSEDTRTEIIGLLFILLCLWLVFYFIPEIFASLFHTILGKFILFLIVVILSSYDLKYGVILGAVFIIMYRFSTLKEGFTWTNDSKKDFLIRQTSMNPNVIFDLDMIERNQASQEELDYFNKNRVWPWSDSTKELFIKAITANPFIKVAPDGALLDTQRVYNEAAILMALSYQTKEGKFLIDGVEVPLKEGNPKEELPSGFGDFAYKSGLKPDLSKDVIRCNMDTGNLERIHYTGKEGIYGSQTSIVNPVDYTNLEKLYLGLVL